MMAITFNIRRQEKNVLSGKWVVTNPHLDGLILQNVFRMEFGPGRIEEVRSDYWEAWMVKNGIVQYIDPERNKNKDCTSWVTTAMPAAADDDTFSAQDERHRRSYFTTNVYWIPGNQQYEILKKLPLNGVEAAAMLPASTQSPIEGTNIQPILRRSEVLWQ